MLNFLVCSTLLHAHFYYLTRHVHLGFSRLHSSSKYKQIICIQIGNKTLTIDKFVINIPVIIVQNKFIRYNSRVKLTLPPLLLLGSSTENVLGLEDKSKVEGLGGMGYTIIFRGNMFSKQTIPLALMILLLTTSLTSKLITTNLPKLLSKA